MKFTIDRRSKVEKGIDKHIEELLENVESNEDIEAIIELMKGKYEMQTAKPRIKSDTILLVLGNLLGIVLILNHERVNVISSKALGFILRGRV